MANDPAAGPYFLDVNIPMYAAGGDHSYKWPCVRIMTAVAHGRLEVVIDAEIIQEILYRYGAIEKWEIGAQMARNVLDLVPVMLPVTAAEMSLAVDLYARYAPRGVKARDVLHVAVMQRQGITRIISTDRHFDEVQGIVRVEPKEVEL